MCISSSIIWALLVLIVDLRIPCIDVWQCIASHSISHPYSTASVLPVSRAEHRYRGIYTFTTSVRQHCTWPSTNAALQPSPKAKPYIFPAVGRTEVLIPTLSPRHLQIHPQKPGSHSSAYRYNLYPIAVLTPCAAELSFGLRSLAAPPASLERVNLMAADGTLPMHVGLHHGLCARSLGILWAICGSVELRMPCFCLVYEARLFSVSSAFDNS